MMSTYGNSYGSRIKIVLITKDFQAKNKKEIKAITRVVHEMYIKFHMNPLNDFLDGDEGQGFEKECLEFLKEKTCDFMYEVEKKEKIREEGGHVLPEVIFLFYLADGEG